jgi:hypothetical protein
MNQTKLAITTDEAQRVLRQLADSLNSLKTKPAPPASPAPVQERQPPRPQKDRMTVVPPPISSALPAVRRVPPKPTPRTVTVALPPLSAFKCAWRSPINDDRAKSHREIVEDFGRDRELMERLGVTPEEIETLSGVSMLGKLTCKQDALLILRQIREARGPFVSPSTPETFLVPYQKIEPAIPDIGAMAEWIRSSAMAKLKESESGSRARYRSPLRQFDFLSSIKTMFSWRRQLSAR